METHPKVDNKQASNEELVDKIDQFPPKLRKILNYRYKNMKV